MRGLIILAAIVGMAGSAKAFDIDYAAVMDANAAKVEDLGDRHRQLILPGPVRIMEYSDGAGGANFIGIDESANGSAGCMFKLLVDLSAGQRLCDTMLTPDEAANLDAALLRSARFVAANTVPPVPEADIKERLAAMVDRVAAGYRAKGMSCPGDQGFDPQAVALAKNAATPRFADIQALMHAEPRLPVPNPCM